MIDTLISSKTRIKLLMKFFINGQTSAYLRSLEEEFGDSTNSIRLELNRLEKAGMLDSKSEGNKKLFSANQKHPLFFDIQRIVMKHVGLDHIIDQTVEKLGKLERIYLTGDFARGKNSPIIDLVFVGQINQNFLIELLSRSEKAINRKIRYLVYNDEAYLNLPEFQNSGNYVLLYRL